MKTLVSVFFVDYVAFGISKNQPCIFQALALSLSFSPALHQQSIVGLPNKSSVRVQYFSPFSNGRPKYA